MKVYHLCVDTTFQRPHRFSLEIEWLGLIQSFGYDLVGTFEDLLRLVRDRNIARPTSIRLNILRIRHDVLAGGFSTDV